jgi:hypothetical protein
MGRKNCGTHSSTLNISPDCRLMMLRLVVLLALVDASLSLLWAPRRSSPRLLATSSPSSSALVDELLGLVLPRTSASNKPTASNLRIAEIIESLEQVGKSTPYLSSSKYVGGGGYLGSPQLGGTLLWGNYEVAHFDKSVDMAAKDGLDATARQTLRARLLGAAFRLRFSFQHVQPPSKLVNFVGFAVLGVPATVTALGEYTKLNATEVAMLREEFGTPLRDDTTVRVVFKPPRVALGPRRCPLIFELGGAAAQPPVDLSITYLDERVRLGLARGGGRFVFTRGGLASEPYADDWSNLVDRQPMGRETLILAVAAIGAIVARSVPAARGPFSFVVVGSVVARLCVWVLHRTTRAAR